MSSSVSFSNIDTPCKDSEISLSSELESEVIASATASDVTGVAIIAPTNTSCPDMNSPPLQRLTTLTHGSGPNSKINDEINLNREKWDRFAYGIINKLDEAINRKKNPLPVSCNKMKAAILSSSGVSECAERRNAIFVKGGAAYYAHDDESEIGYPLLSDRAPRTHDYDFTICCKSVANITDQCIRDFFWTAVHEHEPDLDLLHSSKFLKIDVNNVHKHHHSHETVVFGGLDPTSPAGPSDFLTLTHFSSTNFMQKFVNYRVNVCLPSHTPGRHSVYHICEFIFTESPTEFDYANTIHLIQKPLYTMPILDMVSLLKYSIYAMAMRGLDKKKWRKARQDYARIVNFIDIVKSRRNVQTIVFSRAWKHATETFKFLSENLLHCTEDGFESKQSGDHFFNDNFSCVNSKHLVWYVLKEIGFEREAKPYETKVFLVPSLGSPSVTLSAEGNHDEDEEKVWKGSDKFHYTKTASFWVVSSSDYGGFLDSSGLGSASYSPDDGDSLGNCYHSYY